MSSRSWIRNLFARTPRTIRQAPPRFRPRFEALEDRVTPTVYVVDNATDNLNPGSLRWAITQANANPGADIINNVINEGVQGQTTVLYPINLTLSGTPLPAITGDVTIRGHNQFTVSGHNQVRILTINSGVTVQLNGMTLTEGNGNSGNRLGGAIYNQGTLSLISSTISASDAGSGGAIYNSGTLSISSSTLSSNQADTGGAIFNQGTLSMTGSTISGNLAGTTILSGDGVVGGEVGGRTSNTAAQGGGIYSIDGSVALDHVTLVFNVARAGNNSQGNGFAAEGGGLYAAGGSITIVDSTIGSNTALGGDGVNGAAGAVGTPADTVLPGQNGGNGQPGFPGGAGGAGSGGGVFFDDTTTTSGAMRLFRSTLAANVAKGGAGGTGGAGGAGATGGRGRNGTTSEFDLGQNPGGPGGQGGAGGAGGQGGAGGVGSGGGVFTRAYSVFIIDSTLANNQVTGGAGGAGSAGGAGGAGGTGGDGRILLGDGGPGNLGGTGGSAGIAGTSHGGALERGAGSLLVISSTVADNQTMSAAGAAGGAGGVRGSGGVGGTSITGNHHGATGQVGVAGSPGVGSTTGASSGGGLALGPTGSTFVGLANSIVARNLAAGAANDLSGSVDSTSNNNLIGTGGAGGLTNGTYGNLVGVADPRMGTLASNGGPTQTIALFRGSPAVNAGDNTFAFDYMFQPLTTDQRSTGFPRIVGPTVDIGAYESIFGAESLVVTTLVDEYDGTSNPSLGTGTSLREAMDWANVHPGVDTITFAPGLPTGTITLNGTELPVITGDVTITGPGLSKLAISGNGVSRVLEIAANTNVNLSGVSIINGRAVKGGGIYNLGTLTVTNSTLSANTAFGTTFADLLGSATSDGGGGIFNAGTLTISNSTVTGNTAIFFGGGITNAGTLTISGATISGNSAAAGGGIYNNGTLTVTSSLLVGNSVTGTLNSRSGGGGLRNDATATLINTTVTANSSVRSGGGVYNFDETVTLTNCTIVNNRSDADGVNQNSNDDSGGGLFTSPNNFTLTHLFNSIVVGNVRGAIGSDAPNDLALKNLEADSAYNLIGNANTAGGLVNGVNGNLVGVDPKLGALANNGGPTQTLALLPFSPALNAGSNALIPAGVATDQRGTGFTRVRGGTVDIGAYEVQGNAPTISQNRNSAAGNEGSSVVIPNVFGTYGNSGLFNDDLGIGNVTVTASVGLISRSEFLGAWYWDYIPTDSSAGTTTITITATDSYGMKATVSFPLTVQNVAPTATITNIPNSGHSSEGTTITLGSSIYDPSSMDTAAGFILAWNVTKNGVAFASGTTAGIAFTPDDDGSYVVSLTATDKDGGVSPVASTTIVVDNVAPTATITGAPASGHSLNGTIITLGSSVTDPSPEDVDNGFSYVWWVIKNGVGLQSGTSASFSYTPTEAGIYEFTLTATDVDDETSPVASISIQVDNPPPLAAITGIPALGHSPEGTAITLGSSVIDPNSIDLTGTTYAWNVTKNGVPYAAGSAANVSFTPDDDGDYVVTMIATTILSGASSPATTTITVDNVAPTVVISGASSVNAGAAYALTLGSATDPGSDTVSKYIVNWGDGKSDVYTTGGAKLHVYASDGVKNITIDLVDEDGTHTNRANALAVSVVTTVTPPSVTVPAAQTASAGVDKSIKGIVVAGANGRKLTVTLSVASGILSLGPTTGLTVTGNKSGMVTLSGTAIYLNSALMMLVYSSNSNFSGLDTLNVLVTDGSLSAAASVAITVSSWQRK